MNQRNNIVEIRKEIEGCIGQRVKLKANKGRKKIQVREGVLEETYPNLFTVKFENQYNTIRKASYSYTDVLTNTVEISILD